MQKALILTGFTQMHYFTCISITNTILFNNQRREFFGTKIGDGLLYCKNSSHQSTRIKPDARIQRLPYLNRTSRNHRNAGMIESELNNLHNQIEII